MEKIAIAPSGPVAPTASTFGSAAGYSGPPGPPGSSWELPAAATSRTSRDAAYATASARAGWYCGVPNDMLMTRAPLLVAQRMPSMAFASYSASPAAPGSTVSVIFTGIRPASKPAPETPASLLVTAAAMPATWLPWRSSSPATWAADARVSPLR